MIINKELTNSNYRDTYEKLHRNEEMRRVLEEIERRQEEEFTRREQEKGKPLLFIFSFCVPICHYFCLSS